MWQRIIHNTQAQIHEKVFYLYFIEHLQVKISKQQWDQQSWCIKKAREQ